MSLSSLIPKDPSNYFHACYWFPRSLSTPEFPPWPLPAAGDQAQLVRQQLDGLQERVRQTESRIACAQQKLLYAQRTASSKPSPPAGLEAHPELEGSASAQPELKDPKQVFVRS